MSLPQANFLTPAEFFRGPDLLRPGSITGQYVDSAAIAFIYTLFSFEGDEPDFQVLPEDHRLIYWPAPMGHEKVIGRKAVLRALFGPDFQEAVKDAIYGDLYDTIEVRRLAVQKNLFGRYGRVRNVPCLMLWNPCEGWEAITDKLLVLLDVPDDGLVTLGNSNQWWVKEWVKREEG